MGNRIKQSLPSYVVGGSLAISLLLTFGCTKAPQVVPPANQADALRQACEDDSKRACYALGMLYLKKDLVSDRRARRWLRRSCELREARACYELGVLKEAAPQSHPSKASNGGFFQKACRYGSLDGCRMVEIIMFNQGGTRVRMRQSVERLALLCTQGDFRSCEAQLRGALALGLPHHGQVLERLSEACTSSSSTDGLAKLFCQRATDLKCSSLDAQHCSDGQKRDGILDEASCPINDEPWIVSVAHTAMVECREGFAGTLTLHFDSEGHPIKIHSRKALSKCVQKFLDDVRLLPLHTTQECRFRLQF